MMIPVCFYFAGLATSIVPALASAVDGRGVVACSGSAGDGRDVGDADVLSAGAVSRPGAR